MAQSSGKRRRFCQTGRHGISEVNPARLSSALSNLFPHGAMAAELRVAGDPDLLLPAETRNLGHAVPTRIEEFAAGRLCARRALAEFGIRNFAVEAAGDRQPVWPAGMVGSITHTTGFCAAVVAERRHVAALGLDSEVAGDVKLKLWPSICVPTEIDWLRSLPAGRQAAAGTLIFSAKEAFYKCQYPLAKERLTFKDVRVQFGEGQLEEGDVEGAFRIHATRSIALPAAMPLGGRYLFHEEFVTAAMAVVAGEIRPLVRS